MSNRLFRLGVSSLVAAVLLLAASAAHAQGAPAGAGGADYQAKLAQYQAAHGAYEAEASVYWEARMGIVCWSVNSMLEVAGTLRDMFSLTQAPTSTGGRVASHCSSSS